jgi:arginyl-tRNA synthetase
MPVAGSSAASDVDDDGLGLRGRTLRPGFLNITLADSALWHVVAARLADERLGVGRPLEGARTLVDYSGPNIAKQLHVGHIRSTVIGDALVRILSHLGADVVRANHLGDWGTSFGKLIQYLGEHAEPDLEAGLDLDALDSLYKAAQRQFTPTPSSPTGPGRASSGCRAATRPRSPCGASSSRSRRPRSRTSTNGSACC